jgi:hypothetical protein
MEKIPAVETAKALMTEAVAWSVMKWLREKKEVRKVADQANAALDQWNLAVKNRWPENVRAAYETLVKQGAETNNGRRRHQANSPAADLEIIINAKRIKEADDRAYRARMDAEETFDDAEKKLSTALAREGCRKAIHSWELHERAIQKAEDLLPSNSQPRDSGSSVQH